MSKARQAALGAALGAALLGAPAAWAAPPDPTLEGTSVSVDVDSFTLTSGDRPLRAGGTLSATLAGSPSGKADFSVIGVADSVPMREIAPGVYVGTLAVPRGARATDAAAVGRLVRAGVTSTLIQATRRVTIDTDPPRIVSVGPAAGVPVGDARPTLYASLSDGDGVGVDPARTRVTLDGRDVSAQAVSTDALVTLRPAAPLASGPHAVSVTAQDRAGNARTARWSFEVAPARAVRSFTSNETGAGTLGQGAIVVFTLSAAPGGRASVSVPGLIRALPLREAEPGAYSAEYTVRAGDDALDAPALARFEPRGGRPETAELAARLSAAGGPPPAPRILDPKNNDYISALAPLTIRGRARPRSLVRVSVSFVSKAAGGILPVRGQVASQDAAADGDGDWSVERLELKVRALAGPDRDTVFTITATPLDSSGLPGSDDASVSVRPG